MTRWIRAVTKSFRTVLQKSGNENEEDTREEEVGIQKCREEEKGIEGTSVCENLQSATA